MDWQLRIALIIAGCGLIGYIYYDYSKKKRIRKENEKLKEKFSSISDSVDSAGFDHVGVGTPRPATVEQREDKLDDKSNTHKNSIEGISVENYIEQSLESNQLENESENKENSETIEPKLNEIKAETSDSDRVNSEASSPEEPEKAMVLSLILQAPQGTVFKGKDFLPLFLSQGLRHGEMGIFHRRARAGKDPGPVLFSLANGIAPGTFDINNMENFSTPALACFVTLPGPEDAQVAYNAMYKTCCLLQQELGGDLLDETKSIYSKQTHNHRLDQIKDYSFKFGS